MFFLSGKEISSQINYWMEGISTRMISTRFWKTILAPKMRVKIRLVTDFIQSEHFFDITQYEKNFKEMTGNSNIHNSSLIPKLVYSHRTKSNRRFLE